jgi:CRISPR-associated protein Cmr2
MEYLLSISVGPVQEFIAAARRSRDLWFGSWLLSEISKTGASRIHKSGGTLIFPSSEYIASDLAEDSAYRVVNKLLARVETNNIHEFCDTVFTAMSERLSRIADEAFSDLKALKINGKPSIHLQTATAQLNDFIEFYWAAYQFDETNYEVVRNKAEALLAARKVSRNFRPVSWGSNVPKSSLDGLRESVIDEAVFDPLEDRILGSNHKEELLKNLRIRYGIRGKERLCGIGLLKRHGKSHKNDNANFFSTSHLAALPLLNRLKDRSAVKAYLSELTSLLGIIDDNAIKRYLGHVPKGATLKPHKYFCNEDGSLLYDGHLLFKERLREFFPDLRKREKAEVALSTFLKTLGTPELQNPEPNPYYAILHADGDRMGAVIEHQAAKGLKQHQDLSTALSKFAAEVKTIVEKDFEGSCIYSGGDDVLALLPLHTALQCARILADRFAASLKGFSGHQDSKSPTLSVGLAIGHHLDPLQETLNLARAAEKTAKKEVPTSEAPEKNALAITLSKRSGTYRTVKGSWNKTKPARALDCRLNRFTFLHVEDQLPDGAAYELQELALRLKPPKDASADDRLALLQAQQANAKQILKRKQPKHGKKSTPATKVINEFCGVQDKDGKTVALGFIDLVDLEDWTLSNLADELIIAREFARAIELAGTRDDFAVLHGFTAESREAVDDSE